MKKILADNFWFIIPFLLLQAIALYVVPFEDKLLLFKSLNSYHTPFLDTFFKILSNFAEWYGWVLATIIAFFIQVRYGVFSVVALLLSGLISQLLKHFVFLSEMRPSYFFSASELNLVEGVQLHTHFSFPSGHTTAAFSIFLVLTLILTKKYKPLSLIFFLLALFVGYSRVYLNQHFPIDIVVGSALGTVVTLFTFWLLEWFFDKMTFPWAEKSFLALFTSLG